MRCAQRSRGAAAAGALVEKSKKVHAALPLVSPPLPPPLTPLLLFPLCSKCGTAYWYEPTIYDPATRERPRCCRCCAVGSCCPCMPRPPAGAACSSRLAAPCFSQ